MSSFLDKIKGRVESQPTVGPAEEKREKKPVGFIQLDIDINLSATEIIIYALVPGVKLEDLDIAIEEDNDIVTIQGKRLHPDMPGGETKNADVGDELKFLRQELQWGPFYRQIILPQEVNVAGAQAKINKGVLTIKLPLLKLHNEGKQKIKIADNK
jgi:HSP20 family molecular chaperone IbpA